MRIHICDRGGTREDVDQVVIRKNDDTAVAIETPDGGFYEVIEIWTIDTRNRKGNGAVAHRFRLHPESWHDRMAPKLDMSPANRERRLRRYLAARGYALRKQRGGDHYSIIDKLTETYNPGTGPGGVLLGDDLTLDEAEYYLERNG